MEEPALSVDRLPTYKELLARTDAPRGSSWGLWGPEDQLGTLNLLTDERTARAAAGVRTGSVYPLGLPLHEPGGAIVWRTKPTHHILHVGHEAHDMRPTEADEPDSGFVDRDDYLDGLYLQGSSQWDGLTHIRHPEHGNYNGVPDADIHGGEGSRLGVDQWAKRGIVGRGILIDVQAALAALGRPFDPSSNYGITARDLDDTLEYQGVEVETGDILLLRTGWMGNFYARDDAYREAVLGFGHDDVSQHAPGLAVDRSSVEWLWDHHVAAVASDTIGVEQSPAPDPAQTFSLHQQWLPLIGMPLGEYWWLDDLGSACAADRQYTFLFVSVPLNVRGGVGSPPQAVAIR
ncbi:cyclase family protein [Nocardia fusca]|uniref:cyclase family protein n=1 Tax=Nocardia fusca TaxID=941183 RepID=UPI0037B5793A